MTSDRIEWTDSYATTRTAVQLVAVHVLARRRAALTGRFGLRPTPGGLGTPMFGDEEVLRIDGTALVRERTVTTDGGHRAVSTTTELAGATLRTLAAFADVDLAATFSVGKDTPELGDLDAPLAVDAGHVGIIAAWYELGAAALDRLLGNLGPSGDPSVVQIWPEHFDVAVDVAVGTTRADLGASPGDRFSAAPYLYVGPVTPDRPGNPAYWNAPFGALRSYDDIRGADDADAFFADGLAQLAGA